MTTNQGAEMRIRSGADARRMGKVTEYAEQMKKELMEMGRTEEAAEAERLKIIARFSV